jgi:hypothetical protein
MEANFPAAIECPSCGRMHGVDALENTDGLCSNCGTSVWRCDFCGKTPTAWEYPCTNFPERTLPTGQTLWSNGSWCACKTCANLIERNQRKMLTKRSYLLYLKRYRNLNMNREERRAMKKEFQSIHDNFWLRRSGPRRPIPKGR